MKKVIEYAKTNPKKAIAAAVGILGAFFTMLEQTGWALLSTEQHQAIVTFLSAVLPFL